MSENCRQLMKRKVKEIEEKNRIRVSVNYKILLEGLNRLDTLTQSGGDMADQAVNVFIHNLFIKLEDK